MAVRAASETRARTLIKAKLGEWIQIVFLEKVFMGVLVFGTIDFKFKGAGVFLNIIRVHPSGGRDFLGCILGVKGEFDSHLVAPIKTAGRSLVAEVEAVHDQTATCVGAPIDFDLKIAGVAGKDFTIGGNVGEKIGSGPVRGRQPGGNSGSGV